MIAKIADCESWHDEYRNLYWQLNELQLIGSGMAMLKARRIQRRMTELAGMLGYVPAC